MSILSKQDQDLISIMSKEIIELKEDISKLHQKIDNILTENINLKEYLQNSVGVITDNQGIIIDNQGVIDGKIISYKNEFIQPTFTNMHKTASWVYEIKEEIKKK